MISLRDLVVLDKKGPTWNYFIGNPVFASTVYSMIRYDIVGNCCARECPGGNEEHRDGSDTLQSQPRRICHM
jgi:hypothetical protein